MGTYIGINGITKNISKIYVGDENGIARLVKKGYIGVDGIAKLFWGTDESGENVIYDGTISSQYHAEYPASAHAGDYLLFVGGSSDAVDAFNSNLVRTDATVLTVSRYGLAGASTGDYAVFACGSKTGSSTGWGDTVNTVDAYSNSLVRSTPTAYPYKNYFLCGANVKNYAVFYAGNSSGQNAAYDNNLARITLATTANMRNATAVSNGEIALFAGGTPGSSATGMSSTVVKVDANLSRTTCTSLSKARAYLASAMAGGHFLIAGGGTANWGSGTPVDTVDAYDTNLVRSTITSLSVAKSMHSGATLGEFALFAGGSSNVTDMYDANLVRSTITPLTRSVANLCSGVIGKYALFTSNNKTMEVYKGTK